MKHKAAFSISALCLFTAFLLSMAFRLESSEALAERLSPDILRFHVLADSNSSEDQRLKLEVRDLVIEYIRQFLGTEASKAETISLVLAHQKEIESIAHDYLLSQGKDCPISLALTRDYFPTKAYGDLVFPCGTYDTARLTIGSGKGRNWWCVLYPPLCYTDSINAIVPETSKNELKEAVDERDYMAWLPRGEEKEKKQEDHEPPAVKVRFFFLDLLTGKEG